MYYVTWPGINEIKIGTTARLLKRVPALRRGPRLPAKLLAAEPGSHHLEAQRQQMFAKWAIGGEKFKVNVPLLRHIDAVRSATDWTPKDTFDGL